MSNMVLSRISQNTSLGKDENRFANNPASTNKKATEFLLNEKLCYICYIIFLLPNIHLNYSSLFIHYIIHYVMQIHYFPIS